MSESDDDDVRLAEIEEEELEAADAEPVHALSLHPSKGLIAVGSSGSTVRIYDMKLHAYVDALPQIGKGLSVAFSPCGHYLATSASSTEQDSYTISLWTIERDLEHDTHTFELKTDDTMIKTAEVLDLDDNANVAHLHQGDITCMEFQPLPGLREKCYVLASGSTDQTVRLWQFESSVVESDDEDEDDDSDDDDDLDAFKNGGRGGGGGRGRRRGGRRFGRFGGGTDKMTRSIHRLHNGPITALCFSNHGRIMASASQGNDIIVWKFKRGRKLTIHQTVRIRTFPDTPYALSFFPQHAVIPNDAGVDLREYYLVCGTNHTILLYQVKDTRVPREATPLHLQAHPLHSKAQQRALEDMEARRDELHGVNMKKRKKRNHYKGFKKTDVRLLELLKESSLGVVDEHEHHYEEARARKDDGKPRVRETRPDDDDDDDDDDDRDLLSSRRARPRGGAAQSLFFAGLHGSAERAHPLAHDRAKGERNNFIQVTLKQIQDVEGGANALATTSYVDYYTGIGTMLVFSGGFTNQVTAHTFSVAQVADALHPFEYASHDLYSHHRAVTALALPSARLHRAFVDMKYIRGDADEFYVMSGSQDETVRAEKYVIRLDEESDAWVVELAPPSATKPLQIERPLTTYRANKLNAMREADNQLVTLTHALDKRKKKHKRDEAAAEQGLFTVDTTDEDDGLALDLMPPTGTTADATSNPAAYLEHFQNTAMVSAGIVPAAILPSGAQPNGAVGAGARRKLTAKQAKKKGESSKARRASRKQGNKVGNPLYNFELFATQKHQLAASKTQAEQKNGQQRSCAGPKKECTIM